MYILTLILPLLSCVLPLILGRFIGRFYVGCSTTICILCTNILSYFIFYEVCLMHCPTFIDSIYWIDLLGFEVRYSFLYDSLCSVMLIVITTISLAAHLYSIEYMNSDPHQVRFMSYLSLFTFFMIILVSSNNLLQLFIGWEGVGICSYLLINFWYTRIQANQAAIKAMLVNKVSDLGLMIGFAIIVLIIGSLDFDILKTTIYSYNTIYNTETTIIAALLLLGAVGKSAQIGLHTWLPDAMEGPTPVSSLIHAATMVTAGVFLLVRCSFIFEYVPNVLLVTFLIGSLTSFFAASTGLFQNDLKKVIAYSTCSQLGYMFVGCSVSGYQIAMFHLSNHAFFKALLFLTAGYIIHACSSEQDMRKLGGLFKILPFAYTMIAIASISLIGIPFMSGFYSKDVILEYVYLYVNNNSSTSISYILLGLYWSALLSLIGTTLYSIKLIALTFLNQFNGYKHYITHLHYPSIIMVLPLFVLSIYSIFIGYITKDMMIGIGTDFWGDSIFVLYNNTNIYSEFLPTYIKLTPFFYSMYFIIISTIIMHTSIGNKLIFNAKINTKNLYMFFNQKWYFDKLINEYIALPVFKFGYNITYKLLDKGIIETFGPYGIAKQLTKNAIFLNKFQSGLLYHYAGLVLIFVIIFITLLLLLK